MSKAKFHCRKVLFDVLDYSYFDEAIPYTFFPGNSDQRLFVVTGPNASGKSFVSKLFAAYTKKTFGLEAMHVGMQHRTQGYMKSFVWGDESYNSTGINSYHAVKGGISTCRSRETEHVVILDEPDVGLSEAFQGALGKLIADFALALPEKTLAFGVVTHSRRLLRHLLPLWPHHIRCGDKLTLDEVVATEPADLTPEEVEAVDRAGIDRFRAIQKLINEKP